MALTLGRCHALEFEHPAAGDACVVGRAWHLMRDDLAQALHPSGEHSHRVPQQRGIGGPMDVGVGHGRIGAKSLTIFQASLVGSFNESFIDEFNGYRGQPVMAAVEGIMLGHGLAVKVSELTQGVSIGDAFGQFPIVPILDAHQNEGAQHLAGGEPVASSFRFFQALIELASDVFQKFRMLVDEVGNLFQHRIELNALAAEFQIGERGLRMGGSHADSLNTLPDTIGPLPWS